MNGTAALGDERVPTHEGGRPSQSGTWLWSGTDQDTARVEALTHRCVRWLMVAAIIARLAMTIPGAFMIVGTVGGAAARCEAVVLAVVLADTLLLAVAARRIELLTSAGMLGADVTLTVTASVVATLALPPHDYLRPGPDALTFYAYGTIALWTAARGRWAGAGVFIGFLVLQLALAELNGNPVGRATLVKLSERFCYAAMVLILTASLVYVMRQDAGRIVAAGVRAGRLAARASALRSMHTDALSALDGLRLRLDRTDLPLVDRWRHVGQLARVRAEQHHEVTAGLADRLDALRTRLRAEGLDVELRLPNPTDGEPGPRLTDRDVDTLAGATHEALNNVLKHARTARARVTLSTGPDGTEVSVSDHGRGFALGRPSDGYGVPESILAAMTAIGGRADIHSRPGRGTTVLLRLTPPAEQTRPTVDPTAVGRSLVVLPLMWRLLVLPVSAASLWSYAGPAAHGPIIGTTVALEIANLALLAGLRRARSHVLSAPVQALDLSVTVAVFLVNAAAVGPGQILLPRANASWTYLMAGVLFWTVALDLGRAGPLVALALATLAAGCGINGVAASAHTALLLAWMVAMLAATVGTAAVVLRMSRRGHEQASVESRRAGDEWERARVLAALDARVTDAWRQIARLAAEPPGRDGLDAVRGAVLSVTEELRAVLRADRDRQRLTSLVEAAVLDARRSGVVARLAVVELTGQPPNDVTAALHTAVRAVLTTGGPRGRVVVCLTGSSRDIELTVRDHREPSAGPGAAELAVLLDSVGATGTVTVLPGRGRRTILRWTTR